MADLEVARQLFLEGSRFLERGDLESAELKLLESFHLFPSRHSTRQNLAVLYTARADQLVSHRKFENAFSLYDKAIEFSESYPVSWSNKGVLLSDLGKDLEQAISCLKRAIDLMPDYADAHANLGVVYQKNVST